MRRCRLAAGAALWWALACSGPPRPDCEPEPPAGTVGSVCGFRSPEDVAALPDARLLLVSQMRRGDGGGSIAALPLAGDGAPAGEPRVLWPPAEPAGAQAGSSKDAAVAGGCDAPPAAMEFAPHGLAVGGVRADGSRPVAVVAHGAREAVELFDLSSEAGEPRLSWTGCVPLPPAATGNDVVLSPDGSLLVTNYTPYQSGPGALYYAVRSGLGLATGDVLAWTPEGGWTHLAGTGAAYPNGIARSEDGRRFFVAETGPGRLAQYALDPPAGAELLAATAIRGHPDNLAWSPRGPLLAVSHTSGAAFLLCALGRRPCRSAWSLWEIDPRSLTVRERLHCDGSALGAAASVAEVGGRFYFGAVFDDRVGVWRRPDR